MPEVKVLGELTGPLLVFGGPYSNLQATQAMKAVARQRNIPPEHEKSVRGESINLAAISL